MIDTEQRAAAQAFADSWKGKGYEKGESQTFWSTPLEKLLGVIEKTDASPKAAAQREIGIFRTGGGRANH